MAITSHKMFLVQEKDRSDYGTDYQIEAVHDDAVTNIRVHVQIKGTGTKLNTDGSISRPVKKTNLNYLLSQPYSIYVCYHEKSNQLFARSAEAVYQEYERSGRSWHDQNEITVRCSEKLCEQYLNQLHTVVLHSGISSRNGRLASLAMSPNDFVLDPVSSFHEIHVPFESKQAYSLLTELFENGDDFAISNSFEKFEAILSDNPQAMIFLYLAEINLAMATTLSNRSRIERGISFLENLIDATDGQKGSIYYGIGNAWSALDNYELSIRFHNLALSEFAQNKETKEQAMCFHNLGIAYSKSGDEDRAIRSYEKALVVDPNLSEALITLGNHYKRSGDLESALDCMDGVTKQHGSALKMPTVQGWRIEILFEMGRSREAYREINNLLEASTQFKWIWPWCCRLVTIYGSSTVADLKRALPFWRLYTEKFPEDPQGKEEFLYCNLALRKNNLSTSIEYEKFKKLTTELIDCKNENTDYLWGRIGNWAEYDRNWVEAENAYRTAFNLMPDGYKTYLGRALNHLGKLEEAVILLTSQTQADDSDAAAWFNLGFAKAGTNDIVGAISAFKSAIDNDEDYAEAWFNLGGQYFNNSELENAYQTWEEALRRFPDHSLAKPVRELVNHQK